jgi:hypothetical protein
MNIMHIPPTLTNKISQLAISVCAMVDRIAVVKRENNLFFATSIKNSFGLVF